jgi:competence protein ComEC
VAVSACDPVSWFVRRAGVARVTTFLGAAGLSAAAIVGPRPLLATAGLTAALVCALGGLALSARFRDRSRRPSALLVVSILLIGLFGGYLGGSVRVMALIDGQLAAHVGARMSAELTITGQVRVFAGRQSATAKVGRGTVVFLGPQGRSVEEVVPAGEDILVEVMPSDGRVVNLQEGDIITCTGTIREPAGPSASGFDQRAYLRRQGIEVVVRAAAADVAVKGSRGGLLGWFDHVRAQARSDLSRGPDARLDEVLQGIVMGDTAGIDDDWLEAFRRSGTAHMLSVSGLHVASLALIVIGLARLLRLPRSIGFLLAALAAVSMIPFAGPSPPVIRAAVMIVIVLGGRWVGRRRDQWQVLALAAAVVLALNPLALTDAGFQLSFAALAGILALAAPLQRRLQRLPQGIGANLAVSAAASMGTAPISLAVFGQTSLVGALANIVVVPVLPVITGLGMASVVFGYVWQGFSTICDTLAAPVTAWTVQASRLFAAAPVLHVQHLGQAVMGLLVALLVTPLGVALTGRFVQLPWNIRLPYFKRSLRWVRARRPRSQALGAVLGVVMVLCGFAVGVGGHSVFVWGTRAAAAAVAGRGWPGELEVRMLDVGQGNAVLVRTPGRHTLLFDGGPAGCGLARQLTALGVRKLDVVVISHPHADHFAGLLECIDDFNVGTLVDGLEVLGEDDVARATTGRGQVVTSGRAASTAGVSTGRVAADRARGGGRSVRNGPAGEARDYLELRDRILSGGARYLQAETGSSLEVDGLLVNFFAPPRPLRMVDGAEPWALRGAPPDGEELNSSSVVALLRQGEVEVLLPGDAEAQVLGRYDLPQVDVMVVPHHGSKGAVSAGLLSRLGVRAAGITVGKENSFGHPAADTLSLLEKSVGSVLRTDRVGWVSYTTDGVELALTTERKDTR